MLGRFADLSGAGSVVAAQMAIEDSDDAVLGHPTTLLSADPQNKPDAGVAIAWRLLATDGVEPIATIPGEQAFRAMADGTYGLTTQ